MRDDFGEKPKRIGWQDIRTGEIVKKFKLSEIKYYEEILE